MHCGLTGNKVWHVSCPKSLIIEFGYTLSTFLLDVASGPSFISMCRKSEIVYFEVISICLKS